MKQYILIFIIVTIAIFTGCGAQLTPKQKAYVSEKTPLFTQRAIWIEPAYSRRPFGVIVENPNIQIITKPFGHRAHILPVNSKVFLIGMNRDLVFQYRGRLIKFIGFKVVNDENVASAKDRQIFLDNLLRPTKRNIAAFSLNEQYNISINEVALGMSRAAVEVAIGRPSSDDIFSYGDNSWHYGNTLTLIYKDDRVVKIKDRRIIKTQESKEQ